MDSINYELNPSIMIFAYLESFANFSVLIHGTIFSCFAFLQVCLGGGSRWAAHDLDPDRGGRVGFFGGDLVGLGGGRRVGLEGGDHIRFGGPPRMYKRSGEQMRNVFIL